MRNKSVYLYCIFFLFFLCVHSVLHIKGDGAFFSHLLDSNSLTDVLIERWGSWSSRLLIEAILIPISRHLWLWRICDSLMMTLLVYALNRIVFSEHSWKRLVLVFLAVIFYPFSDMSTASFCATTLNYMWPLTCFCLCCIPIADIIRYNDFNYKWLPVYLLAAIFAANHEQVACGMLFLGVVLTVVFWKTKKKYGYTLCIMMVALAELSLFLICPGNSNRTEVAIPLCYNTWNDISLLEKAYLSISSMASIMMNNYMIWLVFLMVSTVIVWKKRDVKDRLVCVIILGVWFVVFILRAVFIVTQSKNLLFCYETSSSDPFSISFVPIMLLFVGLYVVGSALWLLYKIWDKKSIIPIAILLAGIGTRLMMGLSPTIFVSARRTMIFLYFSLLILTLLMIKENQELVPRKWYLPIALACLCYSLAKYGSMMYQVVSEIGTLGIA